MYNIDYITLKKVLDKGKVRGYDEFKCINNEHYFYQYALKKQNNLYLVYYFCIPESAMDIAEDYDDEIKEFNSMEQAVTYLISKGADINKFDAFKGSKPF